MGGMPTIDGEIDARKQIKLLSCCPPVLIAAGTLTSDRLVLRHVASQMAHSSRKGEAPIELRATSAGGNQTNIHQLNRCDFQAAKQP